MNDSAIFCSHKTACQQRAIRGFSADLGKNHGDTFGNDQFPDLKFDYVLANPHFNDSDWGGERYENDVRWKYGRPSIGNANYAWLQHIIWKLKRGGQAGIVLANGSLTSDDQIRKNIILADLVEAIVILPGQLFLNTPVPCCLWFLNKDKTKNGRDRRNETLFIDARNLGTWKTRTLKVLTNDEIKKISEIINSWREKKNYKNVLGFYKSVKIEEIKKNDFVLTPGKYVGFFEEKDDESINKKLNSLSIKFNESIMKNNELDKKISEFLKSFKSKK